MSDSTQSGSAVALARPRGINWRETFGKPEFGVFLILLVMVGGLSLYTDTFSPAPTFSTFCGLSLGSPSAPSDSAW